MSQQPIFTNPFDGLSCFAMYLAKQGIGGYTPIHGLNDANVTARNDTTAKWEVQVRKGVLEFMVLLVVRAGETYGYELVTTITHALQVELTEGTVYPLLSRLHGEGLISARWVTNPGAVPRKYYKLTARGLAALEGMEESWSRLMQGVSRLMVQSRRHARGGHGAAK